MSNNENMSAASFIPMEKLTNYEAMKEFLTVRLIGHDENRAMLQTVPHKQIEDMAAVYYFDFGETPHGMASMKITNRMLDVYGITADQLHKDAVEQTAINHPASIRNLNELMAEKTGFYIPPDSAIMHIATNDTGYHGAGVITYPGFLEEAAKQLEGSFYVLPSSLHEVLLIADAQEMLTPTELKVMVTTINAVEVDPADRLTDNAYHYDAEERIFEQVSSYEKRMAEKTAEKSSVLSDLGTKQRECASRQHKEKTTPHKSDPTL